MSRIADIVRPECPVFYVDNVAEYTDAMGQSGERWGASDVPNVAPPFDRCWFEYHTHGVRAAWLLDSVVLDEEVSWLSGGRVHWMVRGTLYVHADGRLLQCGDEWIAVRADGRLIGTRIQKGAPDEMKLSGSMVAMWGAPVLFALAFMHCKNVRTVERTPSGPFERAKRRRGEPPSLKYHVLEIDPMRKVLKTEGKVDEVGIARALHICRGHFRTYDETKRLFGRYTGTFWVPAHVRGNASDGVVVKDYSVKAPR